MGKLLYRAFVLGSISCTTLSAQHPLLHAGPMLGAATMREVCFWVQTRQPAWVRIAYWDTAFPAQRWWTDSVRTDRTTGYTAHLRAEYLMPGRVYGYQLYLNGDSVPFTYPLRFRTPPLWQWRTDPPTFRVAAGSCAYINDSLADRPGPPYGGDYTIFESIAQLEPHLMLWLGDNVYFRELDWDSRTGMIARYTHDRALPQLQRLLATVHHYAIWDDHDYGPNDSDRSFLHKHTAREVFRLFWCNPTVGLDGYHGITTAFQWGDVDFFLLDNRFWRTPNRPGLERQTLLGAEQFRWLCEALLSSRATFKIIAIGGQVLNPLPVFETYARCAPEEREQLLHFLASTRIPGVLFLSGDRHFTELSRLERPGLYPLYELTVSPLTASPFHKAADEANPLRLPGTLVTERNFALLEFTGPASDRRLHIRIYSASGQLLWERTIRAAELQP